MKLPLRVSMDDAQHNAIIVVDADNVIVSRGRYPEHREASHAMVRKFNRDWRWFLFGVQPYVYTREDWLFEKNVKE
jgi:hypothetical protein